MPVFVSFDQGVQGTIDEVALFVPRLVAAIVILAVGWLLARAVRRLVERALVSAGADRAVAEGPAGVVRDRVAPGLLPSRASGRAGFWVVFGLAAFAAIGVLDVAALSDAASAIAGYVPNLIAAVLILA